MTDSKINQIDFSSLVMGFASAALYHMGYTDAHEKPIQEKINLHMARQNIDILAMLQEKTKNNLSKSEEKLLSDLLSDLKIKFSGRKLD